jgi:hypothetical protein
MVENYNRGPVFRVSASPHVAARLAALSTPRGFLNVADAPMTTPNLTNIPPNSPNFTASSVRTPDVATR